MNDDTLEVRAGMPVNNDNPVMLGYYMMDVAIFATLTRHPAYTIVFVTKWARCDTNQSFDIRDSD